MTSDVSTGELPHAAVRRSWPLYDRDEVEEVTRVLERLEASYTLTFTFTPGPGGFGTAEWVICATFTGERVDSTPPVEDKSQ